MCTIVIRVFKDLPAVALQQGNTHIDPNIVLPGALAKELNSDKYFYTLSFTFASFMSDAIITEFFQPTPSLRNSPVQRV